MRVTLAVNILAITDLYHVHDQNRILDGVENTKASLGGSDSHPVPTFSECPAAWGFRQGWICAPRFVDDLLLLQWLRNQFRNASFGCCRFEAKSAVQYRVERECRGGEPDPSYPKNWLCTTDPRQNHRSREVLSRRGLRIIYLFFVLLCCLAVQRSILTRHVSPVLPWMPVNPQR